jgi:carboxyl-terminal processing protease
LSEKLLQFLSRLPRRRGFVVLAVAGLAVLVACGIRGATSAQSRASDTDTGVISDVMKRVERDYVVPVDRAKLVNKALNGMLTGLDPHSGYLDPAEYERLRNDMAGEFAGLGMQITEQNGLPQVLAPIDDTPAARAGIEPGDRIIRIDGQATTGMTLDDVVTRLRGTVGSSVRLTIERADHPPFDVALTRAIIQVRSVKSALQADGIGYARISSFGDNTQDELTSAIAQLKRQAGGRLKGFILDLREDPGGELKASVDVAGDFLDGGPVVSTRARDRSEDHVYTASTAHDLIKNVPMVVLIDGASASASEIVAGALQDHHRAVLMGTRSFGKGSVQSIVPIEGGGAIRLTTALYYTPSGRSIQGTGLQPDVVVPVPKDEAVANGLVLREADFFGALQNPDVTGQGKGAQPTRPAPSAAAADLGYPIKPTLIATAQDAQLKAAVDYLRGLAAKSH